MDRVTESLLDEFSKEHSLSELPEDKRFEHFASFVVVRGEHTESFDTDSIVVGHDDKSGGGSDTGIDGIAIIANGVLVTDIEELDELADRVGYLDVTLVFLQAETSSKFEGSKIGTFGFGVVDFFRDIPKLKRNERVASAAEMMSAIYKNASKFRRGAPAQSVRLLLSRKVVKHERRKHAVE